MTIKELLKEVIIETLGESGATTKEAPSTICQHPLLGNDVIVRARNAGVHYGKLTDAGDFITLSQSHRIWKWSGAFTLSEVSQKGVTGGRIACAVPVLSIPKTDVGEILNLTPEAREKLSAHIES